MLKYFLLLFSFCFPFNICFRVKEYNELFADGRDLETVAENTKISWAASTPVFPFKARDFCTIVHFRKLKDGTLVVLNRYDAICY